MLISITHKGSQAERLVTLAQIDAAEVVTTEFRYGRMHCFVPQLASDVAEIVWLMELAEERMLLPGMFTGSGHPLRQYVHAKSFASGAILALALANACQKILATADDTAIDIDILVVGFESPLDATTLHSWLRPLGWQLKLEDLPGDDTTSSHLHGRDMRLKGRQPLHKALSHLQLILTAADPDHIYWLGEEETRARIAQAQAVLASHPQGTQISKSMSAYPGMKQRFALGGLFEEDDIADGAMPQTPALSAEIRKIWSEQLQAWIEAGKYSSVLFMDADDAELAFQIAALPCLTKVTLSHALQEPLQHILQQANASELTDEEKRKFLLLRFAPTFKHPDLPGHELVILRGIQQCYPKWHRDAIVSMVCGHISPKRIIWMEESQAQFENWASGVAKKHPYSLQIHSLSATHNQHQVAIFDANETL